MTSATQPSDWLAATWFEYGWALQQERRPVREIMGAYRKVADMSWPNDRKRFPGDATPNVATLPDGRVVMVTLSGSPAPPTLTERAAHHLIQLLDPVVDGDEIATLTARAAALEQGRRDKCKCSDPASPGG